MNRETTLAAGTSVRPAHAQNVALIDLLDRLLAGGVVIHGHITLAAADIDLVDLELGVLLASTDTARGT